MNLKFDPAALLAVGDGMAADAAALQAAMDKVLAANSALRAEWQGPDTEAFAGKIAELAIQNKAIIDQINASANKLRTVSGIYMQHEETAKAAAEGLPVEGVFR